MSPFTNKDTQSIGALGENRLIASIRKWLGSTCPRPPYGIGDDCAVISDGQRGNLSAMDPVVWGIHFDDSADPDQVGAKLLKRNLSDMAAMGGQPTYALFGLTASGDLSAQWLEALVKGMADVAAQYKVNIVGGDVAALPGQGFVGQLAISGYAPKPILRDRAQPDDTLWVTGSLGGSILGKHMAFDPRIREGHWLAQSGLVRSMIDLTDGLAKDLPTLCSPGNVAQLDLETIPLSAAARALAHTGERTAIAHALTDGEDYELAFALHRDADTSAFKKSWSKTFETELTCIGQVIENKSDEPSTLYDTKGQPLKFGEGYQHLIFEKGI